MRSSERKRTRQRACALAALAFLLAGGVAAPAQADSVFSDQWHLNAMKAQEIWRSSTGKGITVALIDTRVREVPELAGRLLPVKSFAGADAAKLDEYGTTAASVIAGTGRGLGGRESAYGLAPGAKILPLVIPDGRGVGNAAAQSEEINGGLAPAIRYAADSEAKIISVSFGTYTDDQPVRDAVEYARSKGKLIFAAVGDFGVDDPQVGYPAATPGVVGVTGIGKDLKAIKKAGVGITVDLSAPGEDVISACVGGTGLCRSRGTGVATALVSASAALIWAEHPTWTANQVLRVMVNTASGPTSGAVRNDYVGYGAVRPRVALKAPGDPGAADKDPIPDYRTASPPPPRPASSPSPTPSKEHADKAGAAPVLDAPMSSVTDGGHSASFWAALAMCAVGVLCVGIAGPLLMADRRRARLSRP
ncbi:S8 family serine peptidase [Streptomyces sp. NPDC014735]|uniref:S8 family serine peptidase n=1 Tax=unclassified Streptomyces TaxID=2593676 RepID=UPI0036FEBD3E